MGGFGEGAGSVATWLLAAGFVYVVLRQRGVRKWLLAKGVTRKQYGENLKRSMQLHNAVMLTALAFGFYHSVAMIFDEGLAGADSLTGVLPLLLMFYITGAGILLWRRLPKEWAARDLRRRARLVHGQRLATVALVITLAAHLMVV